MAKYRFIEVKDSTNWELYLLNNIADPFMYPIWTGTTITNQPLAAGTSTINMDNLRDLPPVQTFSVVETETIAGIFNKTDVTQQYRSPSLPKRYDGSILFSDLPIFEGLYGTFDIFYV